MINQLAQEIHENAKTKGFHDGEKNIAEMLCLIHSEVSEALEADRKNFYASRFVESYDVKALVNLYNESAFINGFADTVKNTFEDELADIVIRVLDLAAYKGIDIETHIKAKLRYNKTRPHKHGKAY